MWQTNIDWELKRVWSESSELPTEEYYGMEINIYTTYFQRRMIKKTGMSYLLELGTPITAPHIQSDKNTISGTINMRSKIQGNKENDNTHWTET